MTHILARCCASLWPINQRVALGASISRTTATTKRVAPSAAAAMRGVQRPRQRAYAWPLPQRAVAGACCPRSPTDPLRGAPRLCAVAMSGLPMICSALLNSQLGLVVQSAEAASVQPEAPRSAAVVPTTGSPLAAAPAQDLEEWLLSDVHWDPFDMVRSPPRACAARCSMRREPPETRSSSRRLL